LQPFIADRKKYGRKNRTINFGLQIIRHILNLAASEWMDDNGLTWLNSAPKIKLLSITDARKPYPLNWEEQERLFKVLPLHLRRMALFAVNTGCRDQEICSLRWEWEIKIPELDTSVFVIPGAIVKNSEDRLVVLNKTALSVINEARGQHPGQVFTYNGRPVARMLNSAWKRARKKVDLIVRVHDLKHTFGRRLRAAGVSFEDRQDLLGHKSGRITTHYSAAEIGNLIQAANKVCETVHASNSPTLTLLRYKTAEKTPILSNVGQTHAVANLN
jgi:integrase